MIFSLLLFPTRGSIPCNFPAQALTAASPLADTCWRERLPRGTSALTKVFQSQNSWAKHLLAEKNTALVTVSRLKSLAVERLNFLSVALCFHVPHLARKHRKSCKWQGKAQRSQFRSPTLCSHLEQTSRNRVPNWEDSIRKWCSTPHKAHSPCLWSVLRCPCDPLLLSLQFFL